MQNKKEKIKDNIFIKLLSAVPILFASIYIFMTVAYDNNNAKWLWINEKLSDRLENSKRDSE